ncbi:hypothetical protein KGM_211562 [Danaus plexippus plexippus]|uniref:CCHC-type domain-containing protein n=1 Tax=Danaus plexippus plexippus TaxID=278856 RepID=A0A212F5H2_DANPL|nr:hypothetical protein KGM_211562 [Danaus plexippus plexippus]
MLRNCTLPDQRGCFKCGQQGHIATRCFGTSATISRRSMGSNDSVKGVKMVQNYNEAYKKVAKVNGIYVKSYMDTGSQVNVINDQMGWTNGRATLTRKTDASPKFDVVEDNNKFMVIALNKESSPPGAFIIKVRVVGNGDVNEVCTTPRHYELHDISYSLPATLLRGGEGHMKVVNSGTGDVI